jgi:glyceraldehyde-3-phosphate dehydrogenase/erythrose-4-phosphate dehydrogenase
MPARVAINGFGRIGRTVLRAWLARGRWPGVEVVAVNDIAAPEDCAFLFASDSVFGPLAGRGRARTRRARRGQAAAAADSGAGHPCRRPRRSQEPPRRPA